MASEQEIIQNNQQINPSLPQEGNVSGNVVPSLRVREQGERGKPRKRVAWTAFEEAAVAKGYAKYGTMKNPWSQILQGKNIY